MDFESNLKKLEDTVDKFEESELSLDEGIKLFEDGLELTKQCLKSLNEAKGKVSIIRGELDKLVKEPFKE